MRLAFVALIAWSALFLSGMSARADQSIGCDAVDALASLEADDKLVISLAKDPKGKTCVFYVRLPPNVSASTTPLQEAAGFTQLLSQGADQGVIEKFVPLVEAALYEPIKSGKFDPAAVNTWTVAQTDLGKYLTQCSFDTFVGKKVSYIDYSDTFSCGRALEKGYFVVEAKSPTLISALYLPLDQ